MTVSIVASSIPSIFLNMVDERCRTDVAVMTGISIILHTSMISLYSVLESTDYCVYAKRKSFFGLMPACARLAPSASITMAFSHSRGNKTGTRVLPFPIMNVMAYFAVNSLDIPCEIHECRSLKSFRSILAGSLPLRAFRIVSHITVTFLRCTYITFVNGPGCLITSSISLIRYTLSFSKCSSSGNAVGFRF